MIFSDVPFTSKFLRVNIVTAVGETKNLFERGPNKAFLTHVKKAKNYF